MKLHFIFDDDTTCFGEMLVSIDDLPSVNLPVVPRRKEYIQVTDEQIDLMLKVATTFTPKDILKLKELVIHQVKDVFYTEDFIILLLKSSL